LTRRLIRFAPREDVTGVRLVVTASDAEIAINELEVFAANPAAEAPMVTLYPNYEPGTGPAYGLTNIAPAGTAFATTENWPADGLNDQDFFHRDTGSWMGTQDVDQFGVVLAAASTIDALALAWPYKGRTTGAYEVLYTTDPSPDPATANWTSLGSFAIQDASFNVGKAPGSTTFNYGNTKLKRSVVDFAPIADVTAVAVSVTGWDTSTGTAITELEIYESDPAALDDPLPRVEYWHTAAVGAASGDVNLAAAGTAFATGNIGGVADWGAPNMIDGAYDLVTGNAWLSDSAVAAGGVALTEAATIYRVAVSSTNARDVFQRSQGTYTLEYTTNTGTVDETLAEEEWTTIGSWDVPMPQMRRVLFEFPPIADVTGVRVSLDGTDVKTIGIDEVEVYADSTAPTAIIGAPQESVITAGGTAVFEVMVDGADTVNLTAGDVTINHTGTSGGAVTIVDGATDTPEVEVSGVSGAGSFTISIGAGIASDAAGNASDALVDSVSVTVEEAAEPTFSDITASPSTAGPGDTVTITFLASEEIDGNPTVTVNGEAAVYDSQSVEAGGVLYTYTFVVPQNMSAGSALIEISGQNMSGVAGSGSTDMALEITSQLPVASWAAALALLAAGAAGVRRRQARR
jgi:hypothetical protein